MQAVAQVVGVTGEVDIPLYDMLTKDYLSMNIFTKLFGKKSLLLAIETNNIADVKQILESGANAMQVGLYGETPLHIACRKGFNEIATLLLLHGADVNAKDELGRTPLMIAVTKQFADLTKMLLEKGADPAIRDNRDHLPLTSACANGNITIMQYLINSDVDVQAYDWGRTALHYASGHGNTSVVATLLDAGSEVDAASISSQFTTAKANGNTPLQDAIEEKQSQVLPLLLNAGANPYQRNRLGVMPFTTACML